MERSEREKWIIGILDANGGAVWKSALIARALGHGMSHTAAYDLVNGLVGSGLATEVKHQGHRTIVLVRQGP